MSGVAVRYIDVYVLRRVPDAWELLTLRRAAGTRCTGAWEVVH
ncbi:MAG: NUDIX pyrophosphatase, partial [Gemmatimonadetes bacterium]|nr:NUDIX pyrophosphatase [Gemmatimonadota bacterium]